MSKLRVLFIASRVFFPEYLDGINKIICNLLKENQHYSPSFLSLSNLNLEIPREFSHVEIVNPQMGKIKKRNPYFKRLTWFFTRKSIVELDKNFFEKLAIEIERIENSFDVFHLSSISVAPVLQYLPQSIRERTLLAPADSWSFYWSRRFANEKSSLKRILWRVEEVKSTLLENKCYNLARKVVLVSEVDKEFIEREVLDSSNISVIPNGVISERVIESLEHCQKSDSVSVLLFIGNFVHPPNIEAAYFLINQVMPELDKKKYKLVIAGLNATKSLKHLSKENIEVKGFVENVFFEMECSDLFVCPMFMGSGIKNKVLEAMSSRLPVIGSPMAFEAIDGTENEHFEIVRSKSGKDWAGKIELLLSNKEKMENLRLKSRVMIEEKYNWKDVRDKYGKLYKEISKHP